MSVSEKDLIDKYVRYHDGQVDLLYTSQMDGRLSDNDFRAVEMHEKAKSMIVFSDSSELYFEGWPDCNVNLRPSSSSKDFSSLKPDNLVNVMMSPEMLNKLSEVMKNSSAMKPILSTDRGLKIKSKKGLRL